MRSGSRRGSADALGVAFVALTSLQFGAVVVLGKSTTGRGGLPVASLLAVRFAVAAALLALLLILLGRSAKAAPGEGWRLAFLGAFGYAVEAAFFFAALPHGTAAAVTLLFFTYPVLVSLIGLILGRGLPRPLLMGALVAAVAGAAIVSVAGAGVVIDGAGVALALGSSLTFALYLVGADAVLERTDSLTGALWVSTAAAAGLALYAVSSGSGDWPSGWRQWGPAVAMGAFTAGAFACLFAGLRRLGSLRTSILSASEPLTAAVLAALFLHEAVGAATAVGGALILAGALGASLARGPRSFRREGRGGPAADSAGASTARGFGRTGRTARSRRA